MKILLYNSAFEKNICKAVFSGYKREITKIVQNFVLATGKAVHLALDACGVADDELPSMRLRYCLVEFFNEHVIVKRVLAAVRLSSLWLP